MKKIYNIEDETDYNKLLNIFHKMNLKNVNLFYTPEYEEIKNLKICLINEGIVSGDYYFEKYHLPKQEVCLCKKRKYDINSEDIEKPSCEKLYWEIYDEKRIASGQLAYDEKGNLYETSILEEDEDDEDDEEDEEDDDEEDDDEEDEYGEDEKSIKKIRRAFDHTKTGIKDKLGKIWNIKSDDYQAQSEKYQYYKLLKLIFVSGKKFNNKNIFKLQKEPSMENTRTEAILYDKGTSDILFHIKNEVMKELKPEEIKQLRWSIEYVTTTFNKTCIGRLYKILNDVVMLKSHDWHYYHDDVVKSKLDDIFEALLNVREQLSLSQMGKKTPLFNKVFFKLLQKEKIGIQDDLIKLHESDLLQCKPLEGFYRKLFLHLDRNKILISWENIEVFIDDNIRSISQIVLLQEEVSEQDKKELKKYAKYCRIIIREFILQTKTYFEYGIPVAMIIAALQTYHRAKTSKLKIRYNYYRYEDKLRPITAVLKHADEMNLYHSLTLTAMVGAQFFTNIGWEESYKILNRCRLAIFNICLSILTIDDDQEMQRIAKEISENIFSKISWQYCPPVNSNISPINMA